MRSMGCTPDMVSESIFAVVNTGREATLTNFADKPDETLASDSKFISGHNPTVGKESAANK